MTTELILPKPKHDVANEVCKMVPRFQPFMPAGVTTNQFFAAVVAEVNTLPEEIDGKSVLMCCMNATIVGLIPGSALGHAYFIPFKLNKGTRKEYLSCQFVPGYRGFLDLAFTNDFLIQCNAQVVLEGEDFEQWHDSDGPQVRHHIPLDRDLQRGRVVAAYCTYRTRLGGRGSQVITKTELNKVDTNRNVWKSDYVAMAKKTAIRRAAKEWKITRRLGLAIQLDEEAERGDEQTCTEWQDDKPQHDPVANLEANLRATLHQRIGCETPHQAACVVRWALSDPQAEYAEVLTDEARMLLVMQRVQTYVADGGQWENILKEAMQ